MSYTVCCVIIDLAAASGCNLLNFVDRHILGMNYLHNEAPVKVIHRDLKSQNGKISSC